MKIKLTFTIVLIALLVSALGTFQPIPKLENLGVVWSDQGHTLKVLYRDGDEYFVREWDFSGKGEDLEVFPFDGNLSGFSRHAYAVGAEAIIVEGAVIVYLNRYDSQETVTINTVYGYVSG